jgi:hypothetical protein
MWEFNDVYVTNSLDNDFLNRNMSWKWNNKCVYLRSKWIQLGETDCLYGLSIKGC